MLIHTQNIVKFKIQWGIQQPITELRRIFREKKSHITLKLTEKMKELKEKN